MKITHVATLAVCLTLSACSKAEETAKIASEQLKQSTAVAQPNLDEPPAVTSEAGRLVQSALPLLKKYTYDDGAPLKLTKLLTEMAEQPDSMQRAAVGALINLISESRETLLICINADAIYMRVREPKDRAIQIEAIRFNYTGCTKKKGHWTEFRPKLAQFENTPSLKRLFDSYEEYISEYDKVVRARLNLPDLQWHNK